MRLSEELVKHARSRLVEGRLLSQAELKRATSDCYYSMFHAVCEALIEPLIVSNQSKKRGEILTAIYRTPDHGSLVKNAQKYSIPTGDTAFTRFADHLVTMKGKREQADYSVFEEFQKSSVSADIFQTTLAIEAFWKASEDERIDFAYSLASPFKDRR